MSASPGSESAFRARARRGAGAALILVLAALAVAAVVTAVAPRGTTAVVGPAAASGAAPGASAGPAGPAAPAAPATTVYVHILGQVERPGLYQLPDGARVVDAVAAAGGLTDAADAAGVNLARVVGDGEQIVVPALGEASAGGSGGRPGLVNINTADSTALETLPRIGPATAAHIIAWREENGRFAAIEDLLDVTGIGEATFAGLKDLVTV